MCMLPSPWKCSACGVIGAATAVSCPRCWTIGKVEATCGDQPAEEDSGSEEPVSTGLPACGGAWQGNPMKEGVAAVEFVRMETLRGSSTGVPWPDGAPDATGCTGTTTGPGTGLSERSTLGCLAAEAVCTTAFVKTPGSRKTGPPWPAAWTVGEATRICTGGEATRVHTVGEATLICVIGEDTRACVIGECTRAWARCTGEAVPTVPTGPAGASVGCDRETS